MNQLNLTNQQLSELNFLFELVSQRQIKDLEILVLVINQMVR